MAETFPVDWDSQPCFLVAFPRPLVPYASGLLKILENRGFWASDDDYLRAYTALYEVERCFVATCLADLIESNNRLYRLLDTSLNGVEYTASGDTPDTITPAIPLVPVLGLTDLDSLQGRAERLVQLLDNAINGTDTPLYTLSPSVKALLQSIIDALGSEETDLGDLLSQLELIAGLLA